MIELLKLHPQKIKHEMSITWSEMKRKRISYFLLLPYMSIFFVFVILPVIISIFFSFTYFNIFETPKFTGWNNFINLFLNDDIFQIAIKNTLLLAIITGPLGYIFSLLFAWLINELRPFIRAIFVVILSAPSISGTAYMIWLVMFSSDSYGYANSFLMKFGFIREPIMWLQDSMYMLGVVIVVVLWMSLGTSFLAFVAGFQGVDKSLYEAGSIDGIKNRWQELWFITLPSMKPQLMFGAVITITSSFAINDVTIALCGLPSADYAAHTVINHLIDYGFIRFDMGYACAIATVLFVIMIFSNLVVQKLLKKVGK